MYSTAPRGKTISITFSLLPHITKDPTPKGPRYHQRAEGKKERTFRNLYLLVTGSRCTVEPSQALSVDQDG